MGKFQAIFKLIATMSGFDTVINKAKGAMAGIGTKLGDGLKGQVGKVLSVSNAFTMLKGSMEEVLNRAKQYNNLGKRMGIPAAEVQRLDKAAERAGINVASLSRAMQLSQKFGGEAFGKTSKKAEDIAKQLGLTNEEMLKMRSGGTEGLATAADALMRVKDSGERATLGIAMFGEKWPEIKSFVEEGGDAIRNAGKDQTTWGETTQDSLTRTQKAWANMWNDVSVSSAELIELLEPVVGIFRLVANAVMILVRLFIHGLVNAVDTVRMAVLGLIWALSWLGSKLGFEGAESGMRQLEKEMGKISDRMEKRNKKLVENLKKDGEGMMKGAAQVIGFETGEEERVKEKVEEKSTDTRSQEEKAAYEEAVKRQKEARLERELSNAADEKKIVLLQEQLALLREQEEELKKKHPERYKETKEYLDLQNKMAAQADKIARAQRDNEMRLYQKRVEFTELANSRRIARMKDAGASEEEIEEETIKQKKEKAIRLSNELGALYRDPFASNEDTQKKAKELAEAIADAEDEVFKARAEAQTGNIGKATVSSLQAVGGGGGVFIGGIAVKQLRAQERANQHLAELVRIAQKRGISDVTGGTYSNTEL